MSRVIRDGGDTRIVEEDGDAPARRSKLVRFPARGGLVFRVEVFLADSELSDSVKVKIGAAVERALDDDLPPGAELYVPFGEVVDSPLHPEWTRRRIAARITCLGEMSDREWASIPDDGGAAH